MKMTNYVALRWVLQPKWGARVSGQLCREQRLIAGGPTYAHMCVNTHEAGISSGCRKLRFQCVCARWVRMFVCVPLLAPPL